MRTPAQRSVPGYTSPGHAGPGHKHCGLWRLFGHKSQEQTNSYRIYGARRARIAPGYGRGLVYRQLIAHAYTRRCRQCGARYRRRVSAKRQGRDALYDALLCVWYAAILFRYRRVHIIIYDCSVPGAFKRENSLSANGGVVQREGGRGGGEREIMLTNHKIASSFARGW